MMDYSAGQWSASGSDCPLYFMSDGGEVKYIFLRSVLKQASARLERNRVVYTCFFSHRNPRRILPTEVVQQILRIINSVHHCSSLLVYSFSSFNVSVFLKFLIQYTMLSKMDNIKTVKEIFLSSFHSEELEMTLIMTPL